jgi:hypothetical protein
MGQEPSTSGPAVTESSDPEQIREQIEETRHELGDTVEALAAKTDVKAQAKRKVAETKSSVAEKKDELLGKAQEASPDDAAEAATRLAEKSRANPLPPVAAATFLAGLLIGRITKRTPKRKAPWLP